MTEFVMALAGILGIVIFSAPDGVIPFPMRILGFLICWGIGFGAGVLAHRRRKVANDKLPVTSVRARVVNRRTAVVGRGRTRRQVWYLSFQTEEDEFLEFQVSEIEYGRFEDGEAGTLEYRGWEYLGLRRYDLGDMKPVVQPERDVPCAEIQSGNKADGILTHELEE